MRTTVRRRLLSRVAVGTILLLCSCTTQRFSRKFSSEYENISSRLEAKAQHTTDEVAPRRDGDSWRAEGEYEFDSGLTPTMEVIHSCVPREYQRVGESTGEVSYTRPDDGDSFYLTFRFTSEGASRTKVRFLLRSLPS